MTTHPGESFDSLRPDDPRELGPYRLVARLGRGGMGTVFLGEGESGNRVAVKVINRELASEQTFRDRFHREVTAARQVRRFCTAQVLGAELDHEPLWVATEYIEGPSLDRAVAERGPLPGSDLEGLAVGVATALAAIHGAGIVHRDLKPANVLLSPTGPRVIDFGIARALDAADGPTRTGQIVGTPNYLPPELLRGEPITPASDVFSWGCVVAYAGTGRPPFAGNTIPEIFYRVAHDPPKLDGLDAGLRDLVTAALDKDPARRPSVQELLGRLVGHSQPDPARVAETVQASWHSQGGRAQYQAPTRPAPTGFHGAGPTRDETTPPYGPPPGRRGGVRKPLLITAAALAVIAVAGLATVAYSALSSQGPPEKLASVFSDTFADSDSGWGGGDFSTQYGYKDGKYRLETDSVTVSRGRWVPKEPTEVPGRVLVTATATTVKGAPDGRYEVSCRSKDDGAQQYAFAVRSDGKGATLIKAAGDRGTKNLVVTDEVPGVKKTTNTLKAACEEEGKKVRLRLWVNNERVFDHTDGDSPLPNGLAGIGVARGGNAATQSVADFDDFDLSKIQG